MANDEKYQTTFSRSGIDALQLWRHLVQLVVFVFLNGKIFGLFSTVLLVPYLHSTQSPFSTAIGAYDAVEFSISHGIFPLIALGVIYLTGVTVGRVFCGWACPLGMIQDFLSYLPIKKQRVSPATVASLRDVKWAIVAFSLIVCTLFGFRRNDIVEDNANFGVFGDSPFSVISPSATLFTYIPWMFLWKSEVFTTLGSVAWLKFGAFIALIVPSAYIPRFFCRFACPLGALLETVSPYKMLRIYRKKGTKEEVNKVLADVCPMGVQVETEDTAFLSHGGCVHCGKCLTELPRHLQQKII